MTSSSICVEKSHHEQMTLKGARLVAVFVLRSHIMSK